MSELSTAESFERFNEGLKKASSRAKELGRVQKNANWDKISEMLDGIRAKGEVFYKSKSLAEHQVQQMINARVDSKKED